MKKIFLISLILCSFLTVSYQTDINAQTHNIKNTSYSTNVNLFPIKQDNKWGYIDITGKIIITPEFDQANFFSQGLAFTHKNNKIEVINSNGETEFYLPDSVSYYSAFSEDLAVVAINGKYGFINKIGEMVITPQFDQARSFAEGLAAVKIGDHYGFIDKSGKIVINPQFFSATSFSENLAAVRFKQNDLHPAFIDKTGKVFFYLPNETAGNFAKTDITEVTSQDLGYEKPSYNLSNFKASITFENRAFSEDLISVKINNKYGYINKAGEIVIAPMFDFADAFSEGLAQVSIKGKCAYIDSLGTVIIKTPFDYYNCSGFANGLAQIQVKGSVGYLDKSGQFLWPLTK
ncbi:MAG: WG repeat-containing protein [Blastocatellia bacterium]